MQIGMSLFWLFIMLKSFGDIHCSWHWLWLWLPVSIVYAFACGTISRRKKDLEMNMHEREIAFWKDKYLNSKKPHHL